MDKHKRKVDEDEEPTGQPWLSYLLFAVAALAIYLVALFGLVYAMQTRPHMIYGRF